MIVSGTRGKDALSGIVVNPSAENFPSGSGNDPYAVHVNIGNEFLIIPEKTIFDVNDKFIIENSLNDDFNKSTIKANVFNIDNIFDGITYKKYTEIERLKLESIESNADITDVNNVSLSMQSISVSILSDIVSTGYKIEDSVTKSHTQGTDTTLGIMTKPINFGGFRGKDGANPVLDQDFATKYYVDNSSSSTDAIHQHTPAEIHKLLTVSTLYDNDVILIESVDSLPEFSKRQTTIGAIRSGLIDSNAIHINKSAEFINSDSTTELYTNDLFIIEQSTTDPTYQKRHISVNNMGGPGWDTTSFHSDRSDEFSSTSLINHKSNLVDLDRFLVEDSEQSGKKVYAEFKDLGHVINDIYAIHYNGINEFETITLEGNVEQTDLILIEKNSNSANPGEKRKIQFNQIPTGHDAFAIHIDGINEIFPLNQRSTDLDNHYLVIEEYNASPSLRIKKKVKISDLPTSGGGEVNFLEFSGSQHAKDISLGKDGSGLKIKGLVGDGHLMVVGPDGNDIKFSVPESPLKSKVQEWALELNVGSFKGDISSLANGKFNPDGKYKECSQKYQHILWDAASANAILNSAAIVGIEAEIAALQVELEAEIAALEVELEGEIGLLDAKLDLEITDVEGRLDELEAESVQNLEPPDVEGTAYLIGKDGPLLTQKLLVAFENQEEYITFQDQGEDVALKLTNFVNAGKNLGTEDPGYTHAAFFKDIIPTEDPPATSMQLNSLRTLTNPEDPEVAWAAPFKLTTNEETGCALEPAWWLTEVPRSIGTEGIKILKEIPQISFAEVNFLEFYSLDQNKERPDESFNYNLNIKFNEENNSIEFTSAPIKYIIDENHTQTQENFEFVKVIHEEENIKNIEINTFGKYHLEDIKGWYEIFANLQTPIYGMDYCYSPDIGQAVLKPLLLRIDSDNGRIDPPEYEINIVDNKNIIYVQSTEELDKLPYISIPIKNFKFDSNIYLEDIVTHANPEIRALIPTLNWVSEDVGDTPKLQQLVFEDLLQGEDRKTNKAIFQKQTCLFKPSYFDENSMFYWSILRHSDTDTSSDERFPQNQRNLIYTAAITCGNEESLGYWDQGLYNLIETKYKRNNPGTNDAHFDLKFKWLGTTRKEDIKENTMTLLESVVDEVPFSGIVIAGLKLIKGLFIEEEKKLIRDNFQNSNTPIHLYQSVKYYDNGWNPDGKGYDAGYDTRFKYIVKSDPNDENILDIFLTKSDEDGDTINFEILSDNIKQVGPQIEDLDMGGAPSGEVGIIPHKVTNVADASWLSMGDAVNMFTLIQYVDQYPTDHDPKAIHYDVANEINSKIITKSTPIAADQLMIEDSADKWKKKRVNFPASGSIGNKYTIEYINDDITLDDSSYDKLYMCDTNHLNSIINIILPTITLAKKGMSIAFIHSTPSSSSSNVVKFHYNINNIIIGTVTNPLLYDYESVIFYNDGIDKWIMQSSNSLTSGIPTIVDSYLSFVINNFIQFKITANLNINNSITNIEIDSHQNNTKYHVPDIATSEGNFVLTSNTNKVVLSGSVDSSLNVPESGTLITDNYAPIQNTIHYDVANEINYNVPEKATPVPSDQLIIEDSADKWKKKRVNFPIDHYHNLSVKSWSFQDGYLIMDETYFNSIVLIDCWNSYGFTNLPFITPDNIGKRISIKMDKNYVSRKSYLSVHGTDNNYVNYNNSMGYYLSDFQSTITFMSDGIDNWIVFSSNGMQGTRIVEDYYDNFPEYTDNNDAIAHDEHRGRLYRTGDLLKIVH